MVHNNIICRFWWYRDIARYFVVPVLMRGTLLQDWMLNSHPFLFLSLFISVQYSFVFFGFVFHSVEYWGYYPGDQSVSYRISKVSVSTLFEVSPSKGGCKNNSSLEDDNSDREVLRPCFCFKFLFCLYSTQYSVSGCYCGLLIVIPVFGRSWWRTLVLRFFQDESILKYTDLCVRVIFSAR